MPASAARPTRVLIVDDHPAFRAGTRALLGTQDDIEVVAEAGDGEEALELAATATPDVVLLDLQMPGMGGIEAARRLLEASPGTRVLALTMFEDGQSVFAAMRAGAAGYVLKGAGREELLRAVRAVADGETIFSPVVAGHILNYLRQPQRAPDMPFPDLTDREREVLSLIADGAGNAAIASRLCLSPKTIRNHVSNIFAKLQVTGRGDAIVRAREAGLGGTGR